MTVVAVIQARMGSSRLPGKVALPLDGSSVLSHVVRRVQAVPEVDDIVVATSFRSRDDLIAAYTERAGCGVFRGSEDDILGRLLGAFRAAEADAVLRVTADNPFVGIPLMSAVAAELTEGDAEYVSTKIDRSFPIGVDAEAFVASSLKQLAANTNDPTYREHVTPYFLDHRGDHQVLGLTAADVFPEAGFPGGPELRMTLDVPLDYRLYRTVYEKLSYDGTLPARKAAEYILRNDLAAVNESVTQQGYY